MKVGQWLFKRALTYAEGPFRKEVESSIECSTLRTILTQAGISRGHFLKAYEQSG